MAACSSPNSTTRRSRDREIRRAGFATALLLVLATSAAAQQPPTMQIETTEGTLTIELLYEHPDVRPYAEAFFLNRDRTSKAVFHRGEKLLDCGAENSDCFFCTCPAQGQECLEVGEVLRCAQCAEGDEGCVDAGCEIGEIFRCADCAPDDQACVDPVCDVLDSTGTSCLEPPCDSVQAEQVCIEPVCLNVGEVFRCEDGTECIELDGTKTSCLDPDCGAVHSNEDERFCIEPQCTSVAAAESEKFCLDPPCFSLEPLDPGSMAEDPTRYCTPICDRCDGLDENCTGPDPTLRECSESELIVSDTKRTPVLHAGVLLLDRNNEPVPVPDTWLQASLPADAPAWGTWPNDPNTLAFVRDPTGKVTTEWIINVADNREHFDKTDPNESRPGDSAYVVFGAVAPESVSVLRTIADYDNVDATGLDEVSELPAGIRQQLTELPVLASFPPDPAPDEPLFYSCESGEDCLNPVCEIPDPVGPGCLEPICDALLEEVEGVTRCADRAQPKVPLMVPEPAPLGLALSALLTLAAAVHVARTSPLARRNRRTGR